ncbi:MAG: riboflavin synthase [Candidatus Aminicenantes bacterium]|nr:riboflavin synthase [Candidatus Aminicenantes bacterium]
MFTGIIHHLGRFKGYRRGKQEMAVEVPSDIYRMEIGESLAVNGVCLTISKREKSIFYFNLSQETLQKTTLGSLRPGAKLNLEQPLTLSSPLSGHLVTGHIDSTGRILKISEKRTGRRLAVSYPPELGPYFIPKGSVALNGVSLTLAELGSALFEVELIPVTIEKSNLRDIKRGDLVNIECDMIGKYVYNWISKEKP